MSKVQTSPVFFSASAVPADGTEFLRIHANIVAHRAERLARAKTRRNQAHLTHRPRITKKG